MEKIKQVETADISDSEHYNTDLLQLKYFL